ncbi:MAG: chromate transporter [Paracoccaceae bacterium]
MALAGAGITLWATFIPCFLWIFTGAPYIAWIGAQPRLKSALSAITAAVVGVILNLSIWFALHVFFNTVRSVKYGPVTLWQPELASLDWRVLTLSGLCALAMFWLHWTITRVLLFAALAGYGMTLFFP